MEMVSQKRQLAAIMFTDLSAGRRQRLWPPETGVSMFIGTKDFESIITGLFNIQNYV